MRGCVHGEENKGGTPMERVKTTLVPNLIGSIEPGAEAPPSG